MDASGIERSWRFVLQILEIDSVTLEPHRPHPRWIQVCCPEKLLALARSCQRRVVTESNRFVSGSRFSAVSSICGKYNSDLHCG